jgi:hypothetical protein
MIFDAAVANFNPRAANKVDFRNGDRPPLLIIGNELDHTVPASVSMEAAKRLGKSKAVVRAGPTTRSSIALAKTPRASARQPGLYRVAVSPCGTVPVPTCSHPAGESKLRCDARFAP